MKKILFVLAMLFTFLITPKIYAASNDYLEAKDYITVSENQDATSQINTFLQACKSQGKDAFFNSRTYTIMQNITLKDDVSIIGDDNTIFKGVKGDYQVYLLDNANGVTISNIIFDNITIYIRNASSNLLIKNNIFINAKKSDLSIDSGIGSYYEGYYILLKSSTNASIVSNLFLRDKNSLGRGIGLYKTTNSLVKDNHIGMLDEIDKSILTEDTKLLYDKVKSLETYTGDNQGYFMTGINVINTDVNAKIENNFIDLNEDLNELGYENAKLAGTKDYYHRDHLIYAKEYTNLSITGNYFKGMNKNSDGGIKCRDGEGVFVHKNVFDETLLLLYVQNNSSRLKNVDASNNIFINRSYTVDQITFTKSNDTTYTKKITEDYLILLYVYYQNAVIENITIENNISYSAGLENERITVGYVNSGNINISNLYIQNNLNLLNNELENTIYRVSNTQSTKYVNSDRNTYASLDINEYIKYNEAQLEIKNQCLVNTNTTYIYKNELFTSNIEMNKKYEIIALKNENISIYVDSLREEYSLNEYSLTTSKINNSSILISQKMTDVNLFVDDELALSEIITNSNLFNDFTLSNNSIINCDNQKLTAINFGSMNLQLSFGGFIIILNVSIDTNITNGSISSDINSYILKNTDEEFIINLTVLPEKLKELLKLNNSNDAVIEASYEDSILTVKPLAAGEASLELYFKDYNYEINFKVLNEKSTITVLNEEFRLFLDEEADLSVVVSPLYTLHEIIYEGFDSSIISLDSNGKIKALKCGSTSITIKYNEAIKVIPVIVKKKVTSITHFKNAYILNLNDEKVLDITINPSFDSYKLIYELSDDGIIEASIIKNKLTVKALKHGETTCKIYEEDNTSVSCEIIFIVNSNEPIISNGSITSDINKYILMDTDNEFNIPLNVSPNELKDLLALNISDESVLNATYLDGKLTIKPLKVGKSYVAVSYKNYTYSIEFNVLNQKPSINSSNLEYKMKLNDEMDLNLTVSPTFTLHKLTYESSNSNIITVDKNGKVCAVGGGQAKVIVKYLNVTKEITFIVKGNIVSISYPQNAEVLKINEEKTLNFIISPNLNGFILKYELDVEGIISASMNNNKLSIKALKSGEVLCKVFEEDNQSVYCSILIVVENDQKSDESDNNNSTPPSNTPEEPIDPNKNKVSVGCKGGIAASIISIAILLVLVFIFRKRCRVYDNR